jgi:hypothetical protein
MCELSPRFIGVQELMPRGILAIDLIGTVQFSSLGLGQPGDTIPWQWLQRSCIL